MNYPILVLGASDELIIPDFQCKEVFTCNSSAIKGKIYKNKFNSCKHTNVTPAKAFYKIEEIRNSVLESSPDNLISRIGNIDYRKYDQLINTNYQEFSQNEQINFQKKFLKKKLFVYFAELQYKKDIVKKIFHLKDCMTWRGFLGCSTGLFAVILALEKNPNSDVILSGIEFKGGNYFQGDRKMTEGRAFVDLFFLKHLKEIYKERIFTLNRETANRVNIKYFIQ